MTPPIRMVSVPPQAHIVWNEDRSEGVIFVDHEPGSTAWPLTAADDAHQASTGRSRCPGIGSALAEAFFEAYEDDEDRPVQTIPLASLTAAPVREEGGAFKLGESDLFEVADIIRTARGVKHVGSKDYAVADEIVCFVNNHPRNSAAALATREEAPAEVGEVSEAIAFLDAAAVMLGRGEMPAPATDYAAKWYHAHAVALSALRAQPQAREEAQPVAKQWRACNDQGPLTAWREADWRSEREVKAWEALHRIEYRDLFTTHPRQRLRSCAWLCTCSALSFSAMSGSGQWGLATTATRSGPLLPRPLGMRTGLKFETAPSIASYSRKTAKPSPPCNRTPSPQHLGRRSDGLL